jgi:hypothetical protein
MYYLSNETGCLVVDLRELSEEDRVRCEMILDDYPYLEQESYEDNLYHVYINTEGDWESVKELTVELDELDLY